MEQRWKLEMEGWRSNIPYGWGIFFSLFCVWVWSWTHRISELRVGFLFFGGLIDHDDHHSRPRCIFERGVNFSWMNWISLSRRFSFRYVWRPGGGR